jgi:subfamily B ATP-binding cassette protein MsbA
MVMRSINQHWLVRIVLRSISYFRKDIWLIVTLLLLIGASVLCNLLNAWPMAILVDTVLSPTPKPNWIHTLFLAPFGEGKLNRIFGMAFVAMLIRILSDTVMMLRKMLNYRIQYNGTLRVRTELYDKMQALSLGWHGSRSQGDAIYRLSYDSLGPWGVIDTLIGSTAASVTLTAMIWIMLSRHVLLTLFALSFTPLLIVANWYFEGRIRRRAFESKQTDAVMTSTMQQAIELIGLIQSFRREATESRRFARAVDRSVTAAMRLHWKEKPLSARGSGSLRLGKRGNLRLRRVPGLSRPVLASGAERTDPRRSDRIPGVPQSVLGPDRLGVGVHDQDPDVRSFMRSRLYGHRRAACDRGRT